MVLFVLEMFDGRLDGVADAHVALDADVEHVEPVEPQPVDRLLADGTVVFEIDLIGCDDHRRHDRAGGSRANGLLEAFQRGEAVRVRDGENKKASGRRDGGEVQVLENVDGGNVNECQCTIVPVDDGRVECGIS